MVYTLSQKTILGRNYIKNSRIIQKGHKVSFRLGGEDLLTRTTQEEWELGEKIATHPSTTGHEIRGSRVRVSCGCPTVIVSF